MKLQHSSSLGEIMFACKKQSLKCPHTLKKNENLLSPLSRPNRTLPTTDIVSSSSLSGHGPELTLKKTSY